jgi:hypothetical protein
MKSLSKSISDTLYDSSMLVEDVISRDFYKQFPFLTEIKFERYADSVLIQLRFRINERIANEIFK